MGSGWCVRLLGAVACGPWDRLSDSFGLWLSCAFRSILRWHGAMLSLPGRSLGMEHQTVSETSAKTTRESDSAPEPEDSSEKRAGKTNLALPPVFGAAPTRYHRAAPRS